MDQAKDLQVPIPIRAEVLVPEVAVFLREIADQDPLHSHQEVADLVQVPRVRGLQVVVHQEADVNRSG